jgi:hypothetical protein
LSPALPAPIIVTALFGKADQAWFDDLRRTHFPPERNQLDAHLTMFHHLPPSAADELKHRLTADTRGMPAPAARLAAPFSLGGGVAYRIDSRDLEQTRAGIADAFTGMLTPQDQAGWRPHVTVQNKVAPAREGAAPQARAGLPASTVDDRGPGDLVVSRWAMGAFVTPHVRGLTPLQPLL